MVTSNVTTVKNLQLKGSSKKLKCPFGNTYNGQSDLSSIGLTFCNTISDTLKRISNLDTFENNWKNIYPKNLEILIRLFKFTFAYKFKHPHFYL